MPPIAIVHFVPLQNLLAQKGPPGTHMRVQEVMENSDQESNDRKSGVEGNAGVVLSGGIHLSSASQACQCIVHTIIVLAMSPHQRQWTDVNIPRIQEQYKANNDDLHHGIGVAWYLEAKEASLPRWSNILLLL